MSRFGDLLEPETYPGSKQRRDVGPPKVIDSYEYYQVAFQGMTPRCYQVKGVEIEFFTVGQLAQALGRQAVTIRKWEADGVIPKATFLAPNPNKDARAKRRLYSRAQAEGIVRIAAEEGLLGDSRREIRKTRFTERVVLLFEELQSK